MNVQLKNVSCGYKNKVVVENLNVEFRTGEGTCILGSNGVGKTTIFNSILGNLPVLSGEILVDGVSLESISVSEKSGLFAYVPQAKSYSYHFTVIDVILMGRARHIHKFSLPSQKDYDAVWNVMNKMGIESYAYRIYSELSGGEQQIILLARAIVQEAKFVLLDEPASNLDFKNQKQLFDIIHYLRESEKGIIMVSHVPEHALRCCEHVLLVGNGNAHKYGRAIDMINADNLSWLYQVEMGEAVSKDGRRSSFYLK